MDRALIVCVIAAVFEAGCGIRTDVVASKYVRSQLISAAQGGTLTVTAADSAVLAGTQVYVPPGALTLDTVITVGLGTGDAGAGPLVDLGPDGTAFDPQATITIPFALPPGTQLGQLVVDALETDGHSYRVPNASLAIDGGLVAFGASGFSRFGADVLPPVSPNDGGPGDAGDAGPVVDAGCAPGLTFCAMDGGPDAGICVDLTADNQNCGGCGVTCPPGGKCIQSGLGGICICDTSGPDGGDLLFCNELCVHSDSDPLNCGQCYNHCDTDVCIAGVCLCQPDAGIVQCAKPSCAILNADVNNCGACGNDCTLGGTLGFQAVCVGGQCLCADGQKDICFSASSFPALVCISTVSDPDNCGGCGLGDAGPLPDGALPQSPHVCSGVKSNCENGSCICPLGELYCPGGSWVADGGSVGAVETCLDDMRDSLNCGGCGNQCSYLYAAGASCQFAKCECPPPSGICVTAHDPFNPVCDCTGSLDAGSSLIDCGSGKTLSYNRDILPMLGQSVVSAQPWGVLVGCAVSGCHDSSATAGLDFTDPDGSYQALVNAPSQICAGQVLAIPGNGNGSLLVQLLESSFQCPNPIGGTATPMPVDDGGIYHPLSPCLSAQVREWIDQGMAY